jgi:hypothetical protein
MNFEPVCHFLGGSRPVLLIGIALNLQINWGSIAIIIIAILWIHEHQLSFHLFRSLIFSAMFYSF